MWNTNTRVLCWVFQFSDKISEILDISKRLMKKYMSKSSKKTKQAGSRPLWARSNFGLWYVALGVVKMLHTDNKQQIRKWIQSPSKRRSYVTPGGLYHRPNLERAHICTSECRYRDLAHCRVSQSRRRISSRDASVGSWSCRPISHIPQFCKVVRRNYSWAGPQV